MKRLLAISSILMLTACGFTNTVKETDIIETPNLDPNMPAPLYLNNVDFVIYDHSEIDKMLAADTSGELIMITISLKDYNALTENLLDIKDYIQKQQEVIKFYQKQNKNS